MPAQVPHQQSGARADGSTQNEGPTQLGTRPAGPSPSVAQTPLQYLSSQAVAAQNFPAHLLARVQMAPVAQMSSSALQTMPQYAGTAYRPITATAEALAGNFASRANTQQPMRPMPARSVMPSSQLFQRPQAGQMAPLPSSQPVPQNVTANRPVYIHTQHQPTPVYSPMSEEDRKVLPRKSLKRKAEASVGDPRAEVEPVLEVALVNMADEFITNAVAFSCGLARRRKAEKLEAADVASFLSNTWQLHIPGFGVPQIQPYRRYSAGSSHQERSATVRKETAVASKAAAEQS